MKEVLLKTAFVFILAFATISLANGSNDGKSKEPATGSSLWEISGNGLRHNSYLLGTLHVMCHEQFRVSEQLLDLLSKSSQLILEIDLSDPNYLVAFQQGMFMPDGQHIRNLLDDQAYRELQTFFKDSLGMNLEQLGMIKPLLLSSVMYSHLLQCKIQGYEPFLSDFATKNNIPVLGLETVKEQLDFFKTISYEQQSELLVEMIRRYIETRMRYFEMVEKYIAGDLDGLSLLLLQESALIENLYDVFYLQRNRAWINDIEKHIIETKTFIAVGAGHLPGEEGIIQLLRNQGYQLKPLLLY